MTLDTSILLKLLDQASMDLVTLSPENLVELSSLLGQTEDIGREFSALKSQWPNKIIGCLEGLLTGLIRDEIAEEKGEKTYELLGEGFSLLQELSRALPAGSPFMGDGTSFLGQARELIALPPELTTPPDAREEETLAAAQLEETAGAAGGETGSEAPPAWTEPLSSEDIDEGWGDDSPGDALRSPSGSAAEEGDESLAPLGDGEDLGSGSLFGPEGADGSESPVSLGGLESPAGPDGPESLASPDGPESPASPDGPESLAGPDGPESPAGPDGSESLASPEGVEGLASLEGAEGPASPVGAEAAGEAGENSAEGGAPSKIERGSENGAICMVRTVPRNVHREGFFARQLLTVEFFKKDLTAAIEALEMKLVTVEQKPDPVSAIAETIYDFKTILGGVSLLDLDELTRLAADTIGLIDYVSSEQVPHSTMITDILLKACAFLISGLATLKVNPDGDGWSVKPDWDPQEITQLKENLWAARQGILLPGPASSVAGRSSSGASFAAKPKRLGEILVEKGLISEGDLGGLIQAQKTARNVRIGEILINNGLITEEELQTALTRQQNEDKGRRVGEILVSMGRLEHEHVEKALKEQESLKETKLGEILLKKRIGAPEKVAAALREQKLSEGGGPATHGSHTVKVETQKLDGLIDLVGELVITQSLVTSNDSIKILKEQKINKDLAQVSRITSELQRNAMSLRMVQINNTFRKMNRLVRDLAHKFEKDVDFTTTGEDTEIDRNMVETIYDPLVHMIRNSLDHGLEPPRERVAAGKPPKGLVSLKAYHQGGNVVIELSDDGRGLDEEKVLRKAQEQGLVAAGESLTSAQIHNLVFHPGFSTADKITEISGRGMGMDVVRKSIEQLRGKVDFTSVPGQGSLFAIRLPLTLAIIDGMIVRVGDNRYILPTISINESFRPKPEEYFTVKNQGEMIKVRDNLLPLVRLDQIVNADGATRDPSDALVVVVENEGQRRCLLVDEVLGKQEVVIKSLGERLKYVRSLAGGTILGDGRVGLILDVNGLFETQAQGLYSGAVSGANVDAGAEDWDM
ncbi:MAG: chemotaxis protein CheW [Deltaproteobacteria bacterium]|jgi:chemotaxis protein histidine kinase CheA|nr:chemotaxis protein CheW [Deltaproteobacteria bacterium]